SPAANPHAPLTAAANLSIHQKIRLLLIRDQRLYGRIIEDGIAISLIPDMPFIMEKEPHLACMIGLIRHNNMPHKNRPKKINRIMKHQLQLQTRMAERH